MRITYHRLKKRFFYNRLKIYKQMSKILAIEDMLKKNSELLNTILTCKIDDDGEEEFDLETIFKRCSVITKTLKEHKQILLEELLELDQRAYLCLTHHYKDFTKDFVIWYDDESDVYYPVPTFLTDEKKGVNYTDINAVTLSIDYYRKNMREMIRIVK